MPVTGFSEVWSHVSGTRSTRGAGSGDPSGSAGWPETFAGPAQYSPTPSELDPYAPYAQQSAGYPDPYAHQDPDAAYRTAAAGHRGHAAQYPDPYADESSEDPYGGYHGDGGYHQDVFGQPDRYQGHAPAPAATLVAPDPAPYGAPGGARHESRHGSGGYPAESYAEQGYAPQTYAPQSYDQQAYAEQAYDQQAYDRQSYDTQSFAPQRDVERAPVPAAVPRQREAAGRNRSRIAGTTKTGKLVRGVVLVALVGAVTSYVALEKAVTVSIDGQVQHLHSFAGTVGAVLTADSVATGQHDYVSPAPSASLVDDSTITVRYGRPVDVTVNGVKHDVWVHSTTVGGAMAELGVRITGAAMSVPASAPIGRSGMAFSVFTLRHIQILVDGRTVPLGTTAATVAQALTQAGITLHNQDSASVPLTSLPTDGETVSVLRITGTTQVEQVPIPYPITKNSDSSLYIGATSVVTPGQDGEAKVTYALQVINGVKQKPKQIARVVVEQPVAEVENVGTKALPSSASDLDWAALAKCESGGNPHAVDPSGTYYGLYQFSVSTWESLGGSGLPSAASSAEQTERAELLYERSGAGQWPVCGHNLFS